jgi:hypothetical protein
MNIFYYVLCGSLHRQIQFVDKTTQVPANLRSTNLYSTNGPDFIYILGLLSHFLLSMKQSFGTFRYSDMLVLKASANKRVFPARCYFSFTLIKARDKAFRRSWFYLIIHWFDCLSQTTSTFMLLTKADANL